MVHPERTADREGAAAPRRPAGPEPWFVTVLGPFSLRRGSEPVEVPPGLPTQGIKFVAANGGRAHVEVLIDALWPDASAEEGRKGVRNLLARLSRAGCPVLVRDDQMIRVADGTRIDAVLFQTIADRVLWDQRQPNAPEAARVALSRYRGDLLAEDPFCEWAVGPRERLRRRRIALLDLLAGHARRRGAPLEAVTLLEMAIEADPHDEVRYLEIAELLLDAGRRVRAAVFVERARRLLREHGLPPSEEWIRLRRQVTGADCKSPRAADEPPRAGDETSDADGAPRHDTPAGDPANRTVMADTNQEHRA